MVRNWRDSTVPLLRLPLSQPVALRDIAPRAAAAHPGLRGDRAVPRQGGTKAGRERGWVQLQELSLQ